MGVTQSKSLKRKGNVNIAKVRLQLKPLKMNLKVTQTLLPRKRFRTRRKRRVKRNCNERKMRHNDSGKDVCVSSLTTQGI